MDNHHQVLLNFQNCILETIETNILFPKLFATGVFAPKQIHKLQATKNEADKLKFMLQFMMNRNITVYHVFLEVLEQTEYRYLASQIKNWRTEH